MSFPERLALPERAAEAISQIRRYGTDHLANRTPWHRPSRESGAVAQAITQIGRYGTNHHANRAGWQKRGLPSQESGAMAQTITQIGRNGTTAPDLRDIGPPFVPRRRICEMEGCDSAIPSDLRDGEGPVSAMPSDLRDGSVPSGSDWIQKPCRLHRRPSNAARGAACVRSTGRTALLARADLCRSC